MTETYDIAVCGAGDMGHGLAVHFAVHGNDVTLLDHRQSNLEDARERINDVCSFLREENFLPDSSDNIESNIEFTIDMTSGLRTAELVIESVPEDIEIKHEVFREIIDAAPADAILASNTSGLPITDIAKAAPDDADRVVGCHWWFPPYLLPTVEVILGEETSKKTVGNLKSILKSVDREPVLVEKDAPGFVWNRIQMAIFREALHIVNQGIASAEDVNKAIRDGYAIRTAAIGPFETIDIAGLDLAKTVLGDLSPHLCNDEEPNPLLKDYISAGRDGIHSGAGFFEYSEEPEKTLLARDKKIIAIRRALIGTRGNK